MVLQEVARWIIEREPGPFRPDDDQSKKPENNQPPQEAGKDSPKVPPPQSEPKKPLTPDDRAMLDRAMRWFFDLPEKERCEVFDRTIGKAIREMSDSDRERELEFLKALNRIRMQDMDPKYANYLRRLVGEPLDPSLSNEALQHLFDLPSDESPSDDKR